MQTFHGVNNIDAIKSMYAMAKELDLSIDTVPRILTLKGTFSEHKKGPNAPWESNASRKASEGQPITVCLYIDFPNVFTQEYREANLPGLSSADVLTAVVDAIVEQEVGFILQSYLDISSRPAFVHESREQQGSNYSYAVYDGEEDYVGFFHHVECSLCKLD